MAKARPSTSEIDRFLEEVNRRKQQQARQSAPPPQVQQQPPPKQRQAAPPQPKMSKVQQKQVIVNESAMRPDVAIIMPEPIRDFVQKPMASAYQQASAPPSLPRGSETAPMTHAKALLRSKDGLRAAFLLNEIFSPPLSKRRNGMR